MHLICLIDGFIVAHSSEPSMQVHHGLALGRLLRNPAQHTEPFCVQVALQQGLLITRIRSEETVSGSSALLLLLCASLI